MTAILPTITANLERCRVGDYALSEADTALISDRLTSCLRWYELPDEVA